MALGNFQIVSDTKYSIWCVVSPDSLITTWLPPPARVLLPRRSLPSTLVRNNTLPKETPDVNARLSHTAPRMLDVVGGVCCRCRDRDVCNLTVTARPRPRARISPASAARPRPNPLPSSTTNAGRCRRRCRRDRKCCKLCCCCGEVCRNGDAQGEESSDGWAPPLTSPTGSFAIERKERMWRLLWWCAAPALSRTMMTRPAFFLLNLSLLLCPRVPRGGV